MKIIFYFNQLVTKCLKNLFYCLEGLFGQNCRHPPPHSPFLYFNGWHIFFTALISIPAVPNAALLRHVSN
ncbi:MAG: hypothetical protein LAC70_08040 [Methylovulum sp.]|nr:hypothetical protein [Methylovulum sp.]